MKKIIVALLAMIMVLGITACEKELDSSEMTALGRNLEGTWQISSGREHFIYFEPGMIGTKGYVCKWGETIETNEYGNVKSVDYEREGSFEVKSDGKIIITYNDGKSGSVIYFDNENDKDTFSVEGGTDWVRIS